MDQRPGESREGANDSALMKARSVPCGLDRGEKEKEAEELLSPQF